MGGGYDNWDWGWFGVAFSRANTRECRGFRTRLGVAVGSLIWNYVLAKFRKGIL